MRTLLCAVSALLLSVSGPAVAQSSNSSQGASNNQPPPNPCDAAEYRAFDFWLGEWEVFDTQGNRAGANTISLEEYGCLLLEKWTNIQGGTGQSYNFYDPGLKKFRQVWVSRGATIDYAGGLNDDGAMFLEGEIHYHNGTNAPFRGTWTPLDDGSVKQHFQQYDDESEEWADWFVGIYKKKAD